jgi:hypothetical protein
MNTIGISLGWRCRSSIYGVELGLITKKSDGYQRCPFDLMISNYTGVVDCINDGFDDLYNPVYLQLKTMPVNKSWIGEKIIYHTKYKFLFSHESPDHADMYLTQNWEGGKEHFISNNFERFMTRYKKRCDNIKNYLNSNTHVVFILERYNNRISELKRLNDVLHSKYPHLSYSFELIDCIDDINEYIDHLKLIGFTDDDDELMQVNVPRSPP